MSLYRRPDKNFYMLPNKIFTIDLDPYAFKIYSYLMSCSGSKGHCWPSLHTISRVTGIAVSTVKNRNIRCNIVNPGGTNTNIGQTSGGAYHPAMETLVELIQKMPVRTFGQPEEIANLCAFLCSDEAVWINGAVISIDGGMSVC